MRSWYLSWPLHKVAICSAHPSLCRAEGQALGHGHSLRQPHLVRPRGREPAGLSPVLLPPAPLEPETLKITTKKIYEVLYLSQEANFHCTTYISARNFGINSHWNKINWKLPKARTQRPRIVSLPDIIPLRIRWRASTSLIKTDANRE